MSDWGASEGWNSSGVSNGILWAALATLLCCSEYSVDKLSYVSGYDIVPSFLFVITCRVNYLILLHCYCAGPVESNFDSLLNNDYCFIIIIIITPLIIIIIIIIFCGCWNYCRLHPIGWPELCAFVCTYIEYTKLNMTCAILFFTFNVPRLGPNVCLCQ